MPSFALSTVLIIESLPESEFNSAKALYEILQPVIPAGSPLSIEYLPVSGEREFIELLDKITEAAEEQGVLPLLHIECHGSLNHLRFSDGTTATHKSIYEKLVILNKATRMRLFVSIAACFGAYLTKALNVMDRAPFVALLSPTESVFPDDIFRAYRSFYDTLLSTYNGDAALAKMENGDPREKTIRLVDASYYFSLAMLRYLDTQCTTEAYLKRAESIHAEHVRLGNNPIPVQKIAAMMVEKEQFHFEQFRRQYFMIDSFPENEARFPVTHRELRQVALRLSKRQSDS